MNLFWIILGIFLFLRLITKKNEVKSTSCIGQHKWIYVNENSTEEFMQCVVCNKTPQQVVSGDGSIT